MAFTGHEGALYVSGASVAVTGGACSVLSGNTCVIDDITKRWIDPETAITVYENGVAATTPFTVDYLNGTIAFSSAPTAPITIDYSFLYKARIGCVRAASFSFGRTQIIRTCMKLQGETDFAAQKRMGGLRDLTGTFQFLDFDEDILGDPDTPDATFQETFEAATKDSYFFFEYQIGLNVIIRAMVQFESVDLGASVDEAIESDVAWNLAGPDGFFPYYIGPYVADEA